MITISIINESTVLTDSQVTTVVTALQQQITQDFYPIWGVNANLVQLSKGKPGIPKTWWLTFFDDSDQAGALGYHDLTPDNYPLSKIFAKTDIDNGYSWSITASHELMEMLVDPTINLTALDTGSLRMYAYEVADAVEDDQFGYHRGATLVSNFVYPAWFESTLEGEAYNRHYDFMAHLSQPFQLLTGGYISYIDLKHPQLGWQQINMDKAKVSTRLDLRKKKLVFPTGE